MGKLIQLFPEHGDFSPDEEDGVGDTNIALGDEEVSPPSCTYRNLLGARPKGHPILGRTYRGKAILAKDQVWVELHNDMLWVVSDMYVARKSGYPHNVIMRSYDGREYRELAEMTLRQNMKVWDDMRPFLLGIAIKLAVPPPKKRHKRMPKLCLVK